MYVGKTLFAQLMDFLPWKTFHRIVERHGGDRYVKSLVCADQFRVLAFAQLTYRESLRDIEVCLSAQAAKLYHMGFRHEIKRSTLADANETRDWRIYAEFAQRLIEQARELYAGDSFGVELENTAYALDSTTIDLCLSLFPWALFRTTKSAVKMHTLLDLRGNIPSFIHISDGKLGDVNVLDILVLEAGAIYVMDRGYLDPSAGSGHRFSRLYLMHQAQAFFVTRAKSNTRFRRIYSAPVDRSTGIICDQTIALTGTTSRKDYPEYLRRIRFKDPETGKTLVFLTNPSAGSGQACVPGSDHLRTLQASLAGGTVLQVDQAASAYQEVLRQFRECGEVANLDCHVGLCPRGHRQKAPRPRRLALHFATDIVGHVVREDALAASVPVWRLHSTRGLSSQAVESIRVLTGQQ
jgi:Domain of unknown function (DUF4372)/Transposase DDE domain